MSRITLLALGIGLTLGCGKKKSDSATATSPAISPASPASPTPAPAQATDVAGVYSNMATQLGSLALVTSSSLALADQTWTADDWGTTTRFPGKSGSVSAKVYVADELDPKGNGAVQELTKKLMVFCAVGSMLSSDDIDGGLPKVAAAHAVTIDTAAATRLKTNCGLADSDVAGLQGGTLTVTVTASASADYDRHLVLSMGGQDNPFEIRNSGGVIGIAMYEPVTDEGSGKTGVERTQLKNDLVAKIFTFEKVAFGDGNDGGLEEFTRGLHNDGTGETAFLDTRVSPSGGIFVGINGSSKETTAGAYTMIGGSNPAEFPGAFVCFKDADGSFVNDTGCTENTGDNRKRTWNDSAALYTTVAGLTKSVWDLTATTSLVAFDSTTMFTLAPNHN